MMPWMCPICNFVLHKMRLRASDGAVARNNEMKREVCPNDGVALITLDEWLNRRNERDAAKGL